MKKILLFLLLTFYGAVAQNPSDLDTSFNNIAIPANRHCLDYVAQSIETNSLGQMLIYGQGQILTFVDADQNTIQSFNFSSEIVSFKFVGDQHAILLVDNPVLNSVALPKIFKLNLVTGAIDSSFTLDAAVTFNNVGSGSMHIWNNKLYVKASSGFVNAVFKTIFRLNLDGSLDTTFNYSGESFYDAYYMPDGSVFMFRNYGNATPRVVRLNTDGTVNPEFGISSGLFYNTLENITPAPDGDFYFLGHFPGNSPLIKVHPDGTLATDFTPTFIAGETTYYVTAMDVQADYKPVIAGFVANNDTNAIISFFKRRLLADGSIDPTFQNGEIILQTQNGSNDITLRVLPNGKFYLSSNKLFRLNGTLIKKLVRFNANGSKDDSFDRVCKGFTDGAVMDISEQNDGKLLVSGYFNSYNSVETRARLIRLLPDGSIDEPFLANLGEFISSDGVSLTDNNHSFSAIQVMPDGKILLAGTFTYENQDGTTSDTFLVLNPDGTTFKSYNASFPYNGGEFQINLQSDGKPLIFANSFYFENSTSFCNVIRLDANYDADPTFTPVNAITNQVRKFVVLPDDKFLVSGAYGIGNTFRRYNADGSPDTSFTTSLFNLNFEVRADGKIITLTQAAASSPFSFEFKRLSSAGINEATLWQTNIFYDNFLLQPDNKIIYFNANRQLTRFTATGGIDPTLTPKSFQYLLGQLGQMKLLSDGRIAIGSSADIYDGQRVGKLTIINGDGPPLGNTDFNSGRSISIYPNPVKEIVAVVSPELISQIALFDIQGRLLQTQAVNTQSTDLDLSTRAEGLYFLKVTTSLGAETVKLIKE